MRHRHLLCRVLLGSLCLCFAGGCTGSGRTAGAGGRVGRVVGGSRVGVASYYADKYHGRKTASGETFDQRKMTAAHRTLPFGTRLRVTNVGNGRSVAVRVNDRGPFVEGRVIDLSRAAAERLGIVRAGLAEVKLEVIQPPAAVAGGGHE